jgi:hypothetical protein
MLLYKQHLQTCVYIIQLLYGFERNSIFIVPRGTNYFPEAKPREIVGVEGDNKNAISRKTI